MKKVLLLLLIISAIGILTIIVAFAMGGSVAMDQNNLISRLNGIWVDKDFVNLMRDDNSIIKNGTPVMFSISDEKLEYILAPDSTISKSLKVSEIGQNKIEIVPVFDNQDSNGYLDFEAKIIVDSSLDEIQTIKYVSYDMEHTLVRYSSYEMMVHQLTMEAITYNMYSDDDGTSSFRAERLLIKESFMHNEDIIEMRTYDGIIETYIFEGGYRTARLKLYEVTENNQKGNLKYTLSENTVGLPPDELPSEWENSFSDVNTSHWFYDDVGYVVANGIFNGTSATTFEPNSPMTRAMFVTALWRLAGNPAAGVNSEFPDVQEDAYYAKAVQWASASDIISGMGNGQFASDVKIPRQDICVILARYMKYIGANRATTDDYRIFADENEIADYAKNTIQIMNKLGIIDGKSNNIIDPEGVATRAEVAAMLHRFMKLL